MAGMGSRDIKRKIRSVNSTKQITKAMELVSTAKLKRAKDKVDITKPYFKQVVETVQEIVKAEKSLKHEYLSYREVKKTLYIVIAADRGLCGGYNVNVAKKALETIDDKSAAAFITVGKKTRDFFTKINCEIVKDYLYISEKPSYGDAQDIARRALRMYETEQVDAIKLVYTRLISTISQVPEMLNLLPAVLPEAEVMEPEVDAHGEKVEAPDLKFTTYEPSAEAVLSYLIPKYIESTIFGALIESAACEQAARRVAMESASDNADEMIEELTLTYNQARQSAITQEISEIVSGAEALK